MRDISKYFLMTRASAMRYQPFKHASDDFFGTGMMVDLKHDSPHINYRQAEYLVSEERDGFPCRLFLQCIKLCIDFI